MAASEVVNKVACPSCPTGKVPWSDFIGHVSLYAQGAPDAIMENAARDAAIEFAERSQALQHTWCFDIQDCVENYSLEIDDGYTIKSVCEVCVCKRPYEKRIAWDHCPPGCSWFFQHPCDLYIHPAPNCDVPNGLEVSMVVIPGQDSCNIDKVFYQRYAHSIAYGALERLLMIPNTSFYDPQTAGINARKFRAAIARARTDVATNHTSGPLYAKGAQCFTP